MKLLKFSTLILVGAIALPNSSFANTASKSEFPFKVNRDSSGKLISIETSKSSAKLLSAAGMSERDELKELREALAEQAQSPMAFEAAASEVEEEAPQNADERKTYEEAKEMMGAKITSDAATDKRLDGEFDKAKSEVAKVKAWHLLAAPTQPSAFDTEKILEEVISRALDVAKQVFPIGGPALGVFEFLVDSHVENLRSRREFLQNQLLVAIEMEPALFTKAEKDAIRSSVFYSRVSMVNLKAREKARKAWTTYGNVELKKVLSKCDGYISGKSPFGPCFKVEGKEIRNRLVSKNRLSKSASLAFDYSQPKRVRAKRQFLMVTKLGLKLLPAPGILKRPVSIWLNSQYINQRRTEGFMLGWARASQQDVVGDWVIYGSANPLLKK